MGIGNLKNCSGPTSETSWSKGTQKRQDGRGWGVEVNGIKVRGRQQASNPHLGKFTARIGRRVNSFPLSSPY